MALGMHAPVKAAGPLVRRRQKVCRQHMLIAQCSAGELHPQVQQARAFAPATIANLGVGFDWLGCAVGNKVCPTAIALYTLLLPFSKMHMCVFELPG